MKFDFLISGHFIFHIWLRCVGIIHRSFFVSHLVSSSKHFFFNFSYSFQSAWYRISVSIKKNVRVQDCPDVTILNFVGLWCLWKVIMAIITMYVYCHDGGHKHNLFPWPWSMIMFLATVMVIALTLWLLVFKGISWAGRNSQAIHYRWIREII